jgi:hypothetical protein
MDRLLGRPKDLTLVPLRFEAPRYFQGLIRLTHEVPTHSEARATTRPHGSTIIAWPRLVCGQSQSDLLAATTSATKAMVW